MKRKEKRSKRKNTEASENACDRKPSEYMDHIWSYDFIEEKLQNKRKVRVLNIVDEFTHECLASEAERRFKGHDVAEVLRYLFMVRGCPEYIRSDNGPEFYSAAAIILFRPHPDRTESSDTILLFVKKYYFFKPLCINDLSYLLRQKKYAFSNQTRMFVQV